MTIRELEDQSAEELRDEQTRVFEHCLHEDDHVIQRANYFLVAESMILVAYAFLFDTHPTNLRSNTSAVTVVMATFGLLVTLAWLYTGHYDYRYFRVIQKRCRELLPDYRRTRARFHFAGPPSTAVIVYGIPSIAGIMWITLLLLI